MPVNILVSIQDHILANKEVNNMQLNYFLAVVSLSRRKPYMTASCRYNFLYIQIASLDYKLSLSLYI